MTGHLRMGFCSRQLLRSTSKQSSEHTKQVINGLYLSEKGIHSKTRKRQDNYKAAGLALIGFYRFILIFSPPLA
jgi:hypothetical protein